MDSKFFPHFFILISISVVVPSLSSPISQIKSDGVAASLELPHKNANRLVEDLLVRAIPMIEEKLEPVQLPEYKFVIAKNIILVEVKAEAKVFDGWMAGLSSLHRTGDAVMTTSSDGKTISIKAHLGVSNLTGHYRGSIKFMNLGPSVDVHLSVRAVTVEVQIFQDLHKRSLPFLTTFKIEHLGDVDFEFDGLGPLDWIINPLTNFLLNRIRIFVAYIVENPLHNIIAEIIPNIKLNEYF